MMCSMPLWASTRVGPNTRAITASSKRKRLWLFITSSPLVVVFFWCFVSWLTLEELLFLLFLFLFMRTFRVELLHVFHLARRPFREVAYKVDPFPGGFFTCLRAAPSWHSA